MTQVFVCIGADRNYAVPVFAAQNRARAVYCYRLLPWVACETGDYPNIGAIFVTEERTGAKRREDFWSQILGLTVTAKIVA